MVVEIIQTREVIGEEGPERAAPLGALPFRGGVTLVVRMDDTFTVRYAIYKRSDSSARRTRQHEFILRAKGAQDADAAEYSSQGLPGRWFSDPAVRAKWEATRTSDVESMRASSCGCRRTRMLEDGATKEQTAEVAAFPTVGPGAEPFALLHRR